MTIITPPLSAGGYQLVCSLDGTEETGKFFVYSENDAKITGVSPQRVAVGASAMLTIQGSGFTDTGTCYP